jgi:hypothetical protein
LKTRCQEEGKQGHDEGSNPHRDSFVRVNRAEWDCLVKFR